MESYNPRTIYLGIDVHKKTYSLTAVCDNQIVKKDTIPASPERILSYCKKYFPGMEVKSAYEAGFCGFYPHRRLIEGGIQNMVVHAASIETEVRNRVKTDKRDSQKIAAQLSEGRLRSVFVPSQEREDFRAVSRLRRTFMKERIRVGNMLKSFLYTRGYFKYDVTYRISRRWIDSLGKLNLVPDVQFTVDTYCNTWLYISDKIEEIEGRLGMQVLEDRVLESIYRSLPGIGATAARLLINELDDMSQFANELNLFSYCGLTPCEHSSGEHRHLGHISRQGKSSLRQILVQCAWVAIRHDKSLGDVFDRLNKKKGGKIAIVAIARKLVGRLYTCVKGKRLYQRVDSSGQLIATEENK